MRKNGFFLFILTVGFLCTTVPVQAGFPFSFRKPTIKTDYSQTVWDQIMQEQAMGDMRRGMLEMSQSRYNEATNSFAKAVVKNAKDPMGYLLFGAALYWSGKVDDAISEYHEALRLDSKNPMAYQLLGIASGWKGKFQEAQDYFLKANELDPNKADTHMNLGSTYAVQNNLDKALEHFRRSTELAPREPLYHYQLGTLYEALGRDEQAEEAFKKALHYFSAYEDAQLALAALYESLGRSEDALKYYKKAVKTKPGDYVARLRYAFLLLRQGQETKAREIIEEAFSISRFKADGLALNAVYSASGTAVTTFENQIRAFGENLSKVAPSKAIEVEVSLEFEPEQPLQTNATASPKNTFERAYEQLRGASSAGSEMPKRLFKRKFTLPATDQKTREEQIKAFGEGLRQAVASAGEKERIHLSLQGRTADYNSAYAVGQNRAAPPKAVYDPRIVGNDMGLWVMGKNWLKFVEEAVEDLQEYRPHCPTGTTCDLLAGLAELARGNSAQAQSAFQAVLVKNPQEMLGLLGAGTAAVISGEDETALQYYRRALTVAPNNKTAARNIAVLTDDE